MAQQLEGRPVLFPTSDAMVCAIAETRSELDPHFAIPPSIQPETTDKLVNKRRFYEACCEAGIDAPKTAFAEKPCELRELTKDFAFPLLLKPQSGHLWREELGGKKLLVVNSLADLDDAIDRFGERCDELMVQELIPGEEENIWVAGVHIRTDNELGCMFVGRKLRQHPPRFGSASLAESRYRPEIAKLSLEFLDHIGFQGVCGTEFKFDARDGKYKMIEVNQRQTLWFSLISAAGIDLNYIAYCDLAGIEPELEQQTQADGVRWAYLEKDLLSSVHYALRGELSLPAWWRSLKGVRSHAVMSVNDPLPMLAQGRYLLSQGLRRVTGSE
jgi:predicted ATP-grasp superfamily ATP-dependent carboligase